MAKKKKNILNPNIDEDILRSEKNLAESQNLIENAPVKQFLDPDELLYEDQTRKAVHNFNIEEKSTLSPEDVRDIQMESAFGDKDIKSATLGALRGASFGASDFILDKTGLVPKAEQDALRSVNPISSTVGEVAGFLPSFGAGGIARKGGEKAAKIVSEILKESGKGSFVKDLAKRSLVRGADFGADAGTYIMGSALTEAALGDKEFNAENILAGVGISAFLGAGAGALGKVSSVVSPLAASAGKKALASAGDRVSSGMELIGARSAAQKASLKRYAPAGIEDRIPELIKKSGAKVVGGDDVPNLMVKLKEDIGSKIGGVYDEIDDSVPLKDVLVSYKQSLFDFMNEKQLLKPDVMADPNKLFNWTTAKSFQRDALNATSSDKVLAKQIYNKIRAIDEEIVNLGEESLSVKDLWKKRKAIDGTINFNAPNKTAEGARSMLAKLERENMQKVLEQRVMAAKGQEGYDLLKQYNKDYADLASMTKFLEKASEDSAGGVTNDILMGILFGGAMGGGEGASLGGAGAAVLAGSRFLKSDMLRRIRVLEDIDIKNNKATKAIANGVQSFLSTGKKAARGAGVVALKDFSLAYEEDPDTGKVTAPKSEKEAFANISKKLIDYETNPESLLEEVNRRTYGLSMDAPETASHVQETLIRGTQFLASKLPRSPVEQNGFTLIKRQYQPSDSELAKFQRYVETVDNPMSALEDFENKSITSEQVEALQAVYPDLYTRIASSTMSEITSKGYELSYEQRLQAGS